MHDRALSLARQGDWPGAIALWQQMAAAAPHDGATWKNLGIAYYRSGHWLQSIDCYQRAIALRPADPGLRVNLGAALKQAQQLPAAVAEYERAIALDPNHWDAHRNLANALEKLGDLISAEIHIRQVVAALPQCAKARHSLGNILWEQGRYEDAIAQYNQALAIEPDFHEAIANRGMVQMTLGQWEQGLVDYEHRWFCVETARGLPPVPFPQPVWTGAQPLVGKTVLLYSDMGFGDALNFVRYAPLLAARGARVLLECPRPLARLFGTVAGVAQVVIRGETPPPFDYWSPLMSLPAAFGTTPATIPADIPYFQLGQSLQSPQSLPGFPPSTQGPIEPEPSPIASPAGQRWGFVWASGKTGATARKRSTALAQWAALLRSPGYQFLSLQTETSPEERAWLADRGIPALGDRLTDFADTAHVIAQLDGVITVDTATAHLAGAIGKPVWILLPAVPDWRWLLNTDRTPWYPTARLFRQPKIGDWAAVFDQVQRALAP